MAFQAVASTAAEAATTLFDQDYYIEINEARWQAALAILSGLPEIRTCLDAGAGPGWFAAKLSALGYSVVGVEGRPELAAAARDRVAEVLFAVVDLEAKAAAAALPPSDLVFCFGLLYHLENPFAAIRHLHALTRRYMLIETQILPGEGLDFRLISEGQNATQGLHHHALIPTRQALVKMLKVAGFHRVLRFEGSVDHPDFVDGSEKHHRREIFLATDEVIDLPSFIEEEALAAPKIDYRR